MMTTDELMARRADLGAQYESLVRQLLDVRVELQAIDDVTVSPIAGARNHESGFIHAAVNELPTVLAHGAFCRPSPYGRLSDKVNNRIAELAESLRASPPRAAA